MEEKLAKKYIPMTEPTFYTLLALLEQRHGYSIMQYVSQISQLRVKLGAGTLYGLLARLCDDGMIQMVSDNGKRKTYFITLNGMTALQLECERLHHQLSTAMAVISQGAGEGDPAQEAELVSG